jgi:hypothetical protein
VIGKAAMIDPVEHPGGFKCGACGGVLFVVETRPYRFVEVRLWIQCPCGWAQWICSFDDPAIKRVSERSIFRNPGV